MTTVDIVIVNWNSGLQLQECINSIIDSNGIECLGKVIIVDNGSTDESYRLEVDGVTNIVVQLNEINIGFSAACNQGARLGNSEYILFLNPDAILSPDTLLITYDWMNKIEHASFGIVGVQLKNQDGIISRSCCRLPSFSEFMVKTFGLQSISIKLEGYQMLEWDHATSKEVGHVMGSYYYVRRNVFELLKGFDERFFVYLEDLDFSLRAKQKGFKSYYLTDTQAFHKGGGTSDQVKARRLYYSLSSRVLFVNKHFKTVPSSIIIIGTLCIEPCIRIFSGIFSLSFRRIFETLHGYYLLWKSLPKLLLRDFTTIKQ